MLYRTPGHTGTAVSAIALGTWTSAPSSSPPKARTTTDTDVGGGSEAPLGQPITPAAHRH